MEKRLILTREGGKRTSKVAAETVRMESQAGKALRECGGENPYKIT
jgi:hypothetical protein